MSITTTHPAPALPEAATAEDPKARLLARRTVIAGSGVALLACAACGSKSTASAGSATSPASAAGTSSSAGVASTSSSAAASTSSSAGVTGTAGAPGGASIASVSDIPANSGLIATTPAGQVILAKANGKVVAHTAVCTHQGAIIDGAGTCPLHGSKFDPATGAVINGPATEPLAVVPVTESGGKIYAA